MKPVPSFHYPLAIQAGILTLMLVGVADAQAQTAQPTAKQDGGGAGFVMEERPSFRFGEAVRVDVTTLLDFEWRDMSDGTEFGRRRIGVDGRLFGVVAFEVERDLGDDADPWRDVLVEYRQYRAARIRGGHFKIPFGAERLTPVSELAFARRSIVTETLTPGRDTGVQVSGRLFGDGLTYLTGAFRHDGSRPPTTDSDPWRGGTTVAARVVIAPFAAAPVKVLRRIETGVGFTHGDLAEGLNSPAVQMTSGYEAFLPMYVAGSRRRLGLDVGVAAGRFSARGEVIRMTDQRRQQALTGGDLPDLVAQGWQVGTAWMAIGDVKNGTRAPKRPLFGGGAGAIEIAARAEGLRFRSHAPWDEPFRNPRAANVLANDLYSWTAGVNWYPVRYLKLQVNLVREHLADPERRPDAGRAWTTSRVFRVQFAL
jgi:phosphate-selective porin